MPSTSATSRFEPPALRWGGWARAWTGLWMLLQLLMVAAAPAVDAGIGHANQVVAHWEDSGGGDCPSSHGAEECQICHLVLKARALTASAAVPAILASADQAVSEHTLLAPRSFAFLEGHSSRAPPLG